MPKRSAGLLVYRRARRGGEDIGGEVAVADDRAVADDEAVVVKVLLVHPGGPYWARKDASAWSIPKGELDEQRPHGEAEQPLAVARREFREELGVDAPTGPFVDLGELRQAGGKHVRCWAVEGDVDVTATVSNEFEMEWPPRSGRRQSFPEVDRAAWFPLEEARVKLLASQLPFLDRLVAALS